MTRPRTPYRPLDITVPFPELSAYARTATRLHPCPGTPTAADSSVGGPLLWPAAEAWPVCGEHGGAPLLPLAQFHVGDVPDLPPFAPPGTDLLQVLWCPRYAHEDGPFSHFGPYTRLVWRRAAEVTGPLAVPSPPPVTEERYVPVPCVVHPEQVVEYPFADYLPKELDQRIMAWEDELQARIGPSAPWYQYDLSLAPGWKIGGWDSWHRTDLVRVYCDACGTEMRVLLTIDSYEGNGAADSWGRYGDPGRPTGIAVGRDGEYRAFVCPADPSHPHRMSMQ
ncbi:hypothetical protein AB0A60_30160 [Streptomyces sp. NPDC046275]|uniref:hypothetical protein n=1 Tax=Streptomyces sp. NPDC046275 TaxID=3157201 RepID=UPI0033DFF573